jgi:hypothetical protein
LEVILVAYAITPWLKLNFSYRCIYTYNCLNCNRKSGWKMNNYHFFSWHLLMDDNWVIGMVILLLQQYELCDTLEKHWWNVWHNFLLFFNILKNQLFNIFIDGHWISFVIFHGYSMLLSIGFPIYLNCEHNSIHDQTYTCDISLFCTKFITYYIYMG